MRQFGTALLLLGSMRFNLSDAATLPIPCVSGVCGSFVTSGQATAAQTANTFTVNQLTDKAILNWASFNISADGTVVFNQLTGKNAIALNRIHDANPSQIFGSLKSNGQIYLINQNGILFGATANVNVGGLLASTLNMTDQVFNDGLLSALQTGASTGAQNALFKDGASSTIAVKPGAKITTNDAGQRILLAAGTVENAGDLTAIDGGQVVLAAGQKVYIAASDDAKLRGLLVEVDGGGTVTNTGSVTAERGNVTAVGLAVNQNGRVSASTSVSENGSIRLLARDTVSTGRADSGIFQIQAVTRGGALTLGAGSSTQVNLDTASTAKAIDDQEQSPSTVDLIGKTIDLKAGSQVVAHGGQLTAIAASTLATLGNNIDNDPAARFRMEDGAVIDLSGSVANTSVTRNLVTVELRANELADAPLQRDGVLRGKTVVIDARVGTPIAKVDGAIALIERDVAERTSTGGTVAIESAGDVVMAAKANINVSGGAVNYAGGAMRTSQLVKADGTTVDIGNASPNEIYSGLITPAYKKVDDRWGIIQEISGPGLGQFEAGYVDGKSAGTVQLLGSRMVLQGGFTGVATPGVNQRTPSTAPLGGQFVLGTLANTANPSGYHAPEVLLSQTVPNIVVGPGGTLPDGLSLQLSTDFIARGGFSRVSLSSDKAITLAADSPLDLGAGGSLLLQAPRVDLRSNVTSAGGSITASARNVTNYTLSNPGLFLADGVTLDVNGRWINDSQLLVGTVPTAAAFINAGSITLQQLLDGGRLRLGSNVSLLADGGAWQKQNGTLTGGAGGNLALLSPLAGGLNKVFDIGSNLTMAGFGVANAKGGSFRLTLPRFNIAPATQALQVSNIATTTAGGGVAIVGTQLFTDYGFTSFNLLADGLPLGNDLSKTTVKIVGNANINLAARTLQFNTDTALVPNANNVIALTASRLPLTYQRQAVSLALAVAPQFGLLDRYGSLVVDSGAVIQGTALSSVSLASSADLLFNGEIDVRDGSVTFAGTSPGVNTQNFYVPRKLQLGAGSLIDVSGGTLYRPNDSQLQLGTVLNGGNVRLTAERGSVLTQAGSAINVSGSQAQLDLLSDAATDAYTRRLVTSSGGSLNVKATEGIALQGSLQAVGGGTSAEGNNTGGTLSVAITRTVPVEGAASFPKGPRVLQLLNQSTSSPANGVAAIDANLVKNSKVDSVNLLADDEIDIGAGVDLTLARSLMLDTTRLGMLGIGPASLTAGYMGVGPAQFVSVRPAASTGTGQLTLRAAQIDLFESVSLRNISQATFISDGDINLRGYGTFPTALGGALTSAANLTFRASRVIPTTGSSFALNAASTMRFEQVGNGTAIPLSAGGELQVNAQNIFQSGSLLAPFGHIALNGSNSVQLTNGSLTSVSGNGALIPYGRVDNGNSWLFGQNSSALSELTAIPERAIDITSPNALLAQGSVIDISGGGDLYAAQFTPGTGGSRDVLAGGVLANTYVILPSLAGQSMPYDPMMWANSGLKVGQSLYVAAGSSLPAGTYQLLPARYALLPGAYLVNPAAASYQTLTPGQTAKTVDGAAIVAGYTGFQNQLNPVATYSGYEIRPGSYARSLAQYDDYLASKFFAGTSLSTGARNNVPADSGTLAVAVSQSLSALATVRAKAAAGGDNATIELSAPAIVVTQGGASVPTGKVALADSVLSGWNAGHLILGGTLSADGSLDVGTQTVEVQAGASVKADEIILAATQAISVGTGASLATGSAASATATPVDSLFATPKYLTLSGSNAGKAAVLSLSDLAYNVVRRSVPTASNGATVSVTAGATLATRGALAVDAPGTIVLPGSTIAAENASFALTASRLVFGNTATGVNALTLDTSLTSVLQRARSITLGSASTIDLAQATNLAGTVAKPIQSITLDAAGINSLVPGIASSFTANRIVLANSSATTAGISAGTGTLALNTTDLQFGSGVLGLSGLGSTSITASNQLRASSTGGLLSGGALLLSGTALTADSGARLTLDAGNNNLTLTAASSPAPTLSSQNMGGVIELRGKDISSNMTILAPAGAVALTAQGNISLRDAARIDASGYQPALATTSANGGYINLQAGGNIEMSTTSTLAVAAGTAADAGFIDINAGGTATLNGSLSGIAPAGQEGGSFKLKAGAVNGLSALNRQLQTGGFSGDRSYQLTTGNLLLDAGDDIRARNITLRADAGSITLNGQLSVINDERRGSMAITAANDVIVGTTAALIADASDAKRYRAGNIELTTTSGRIKIAPGSSVRAQGLNQSGSLVLTAPATATDFNLDTLPADLSKVDQLILQPAKTYTLAANPTDSALQTIRSNAASYVTAARLPTLTRLGLTSSTTVQYRPYLALERTGDLTLGDLELANWRFASQPATLAFSATGSVRLNGTISDGYSGEAETLDLLGTVASKQRSSSLYFTAGSDIILAADGIVRTGTGDLRLKAGRDLLLGAGANVYTGGLKAANGISSSEGITNYADLGGSITLAAGRDIVGSVVTQSPADWVLRTRYSTPSGGIGVNWGIDANAFRWNIGALAGGDIRIAAGRNAVDISAAVADSAYTTVNGTRLSLGGGNLRLQTGGDVQSGYFYVANGIGDLLVRGSLSSSGNRLVNNKALGSLLISGDSSYRVSAVGNVLLEGELPLFGLIPSRSADDFSTDNYLFFNRYADARYTSIQSAGGTLILENIPDTFLDEDTIAGSETDIRLPGTLTLSAFGRDLSASGSMMSAASGQLSLYAQRDILAGDYLMSDVRSALYTATNASDYTGFYTDYQSSAKDLVHSADALPVQVSAGRDIVDVGLLLPKAAEIRAGRDLANLLLDVQQIGPAKATLVSAGRDVTNYSKTLDGISRGGLTVGGEGLVQVLAGRNIDFEFGRGVATIGRLVNPNLPSAKGADILVLAGLSSALGLQANSQKTDFMSAVVTPSDTYRAELVTYVAQATGATGLAYDQALARFRALPLSRQLPWATGVLFRELVASGRAANTSATEGFTRGYKAIEGLFPGNKPDDAAASNPFAGDLTLPFSRVYTLSGGNIALLVPGGQIDVGLSTPPTGLSSQIIRNASDLGIVAQGTGSVDIFANNDVNVNSSRIFTLGGGDIAIWSSKGNIDAGKGAKSAISAPPPTLLVDAQGNVVVSASSAVAGSGIRTIITDPKAPTGNVDLIAPLGFVNAGDAGIGSAGNLNIAAQTVVGLDNIQIGGSSSGVPAEAGGIGVSLAGASAAGSSSTNAASDSASNGAAAKDQAPSVGQAALSFLEVFVLGLGEDTCRQDDLECLKRQKVQ